MTPDQTEDASFDVAGPELLTTAEMYRADAFAIAAGTPGRVLMETAGRAVADAICDRWDARPTAVLCGPGNNGGDGFVIARLLADRGWPVTLFLLGGLNKLTGDAALAAADWQGETHMLSAQSTHGAELVLDAIFGAGLTRPLEGISAVLAEDSHKSDVPHVAVDVPSGTDGNTGAELGTAFAADLTDTFPRATPGHVLLPGRVRCGELVVAPIGIPDASIEEVTPQAFHNGPSLWGQEFPLLRNDGHKYSRGHAVVVSGGATTTGAARLAARGALRAGAGLVTVASPEDALAVNAAQLTAIMLVEFDGAPGITSILEDKRKNAVLIGPGSGVGAFTRARTLAVLKRGAASVLDADALTSFEGMADMCWSVVQQLPERPVVLTPHEGEFKRLFPDLGEHPDGKPGRVREAARQSGAVVVLKGADTVIADPQGRLAINSNAPPTLATAGSGDVLGGFILAQLAQGVPVFEAACIGVWLHGEAATHFGPGLIAEDLPEMLPDVLEELEVLHG
ncbi:MAG: NAD(P)H-hydrate dehydratase [Candidatus Phaeomarinobacter sp.]